MPDIALTSEQKLKDERFTRGAIQIAQGATWFGLSVLIGSALEYLIQGFLAAHLGPNDFGIFNLGFQISEIVFTFAILAMPGAVTYFIPLLKATGDFEQINRMVNFSIWLSFLVSIVVAGILFLTAHPIATLLFEEPGLSPVIRLFALALPTYVLSAVLVGGLRGFKRSREASLLSSTYERAIRLVFIILFLTLGLGVQAPVLAFLPSTLIISILGLYYLRSVMNVSFSLARPSPAISRKIFNYTWPLLFSHLLNRLMPAMQPMLLAHFYDAYNVGLYSVAWLLAPKLFATIVNAFVFLYVPVISEMAGQNDTEGMQRLYRLVTKWQFIVVLPAYSLVMAMPEEFLSLIGSQYAEANDALRLLATSILISISFGPVGATLLATGHTRIHLFLNIIGTFIGAAVGLLLIPSFGLVGASLAHLLTLAAWNALAWFTVYRRYGLHPFSPQYFGIIFLSLAGLLILYPFLVVATKFTIWILVLVAPVFTLLYVFILVKSGILDKDSQVIAAKFSKMLLQKAVDFKAFVWSKIKGS